MRSGAIAITLWFTSSPYHPGTPAGRVRAVVMCQPMIGGHGPGSRAECGFEENTDLVGAINILVRRRRLAACADPCSRARSVKQEPPRRRCVAQSMRRAVTISGLKAGTDIKGSGDPTSLACAMGHSAVDGWRCEDKDGRSTNSATVSGQ